MAEAETVRFTGACWWQHNRFDCSDRWVQDGRFVENLPEADRSVDLGHSFLVPPFGEAHNHDLADPRVDRFSRAYLAAGVLYGFCPGNTPDSREAAERVRDSRLDLRVAYTDGLITAPGGHPWGLAVRNENLGIFPAGGSEGTFIHSIASTKDLDARWPIIASQPWVKIVLRASEQHSDRAGIRAAFSTYGLDPELAGEIVSRAHSEGKRVVAHVDTAEDFRVAVAAGVDLIAHTPGAGMIDADIDLADDCCALTPADAEAAASAGTVVTTTLGPTLRALRGEDALSDASRIFNLLRRNIELLKEAGVSLVIGSDGYGADPAMEAKELLRSEFLTPTELIQAWSENTVRTIFHDQALGHFAKGALANFVVLDRDPLADPTALFDVQGLFVAGARVER